MPVKTNIKDVPVCNARIAEETAAYTRLPKMLVDDVVNHVGHFIAQTIRSGTMQNVMLPGFGKFQPKKKLVNTKNKIHQNRKNGMDLLYRAVTGMKIIDTRKTDTDEVIRNRSGHRNSTTEQAVDSIDTAVQEADNP